MVRKGSIVPKTSIKSILFKNLRHINNKENINVNNINVINSKIDKEREENSVSKNNKSSVLKTIEKSSSGLSIHSRLFTEIDNKSIIKLIEKDDKSNFTNKKKRNMPLIASRILNFTGNKRDSKIINNIPKGNSNYQKVNVTDTVEVLITNY